MILLGEEPEIREDVYCEPISHNLPLFRAINPGVTSDEDINLKLRQSNLELKLRQQKLGIHKFGNRNDSAIWEGKLEQWHKLTEQDLKERQLYNLLIPNSTLNNWVSVCKKRQQRIEQDVEIELTWLRIDRDSWWGIAFEMAQANNNQPTNNHFKRVVDRVSQTYYQPKLSVNNSYGYSSWLSRCLSQHFMIAKNNH